jgi:hypothetical protein
VTTPAATSAHRSERLFDALAAPPFGAHTNGLDACSWVPLLDLSYSDAYLLLTALCEVGIPACAAPPRPLLTGRATVRVWVDAVRHTSAEDVTRRTLGHRSAHHASSEGDEPR